MSESTHSSHHPLDHVLVIESDELYATIIGEMLREGARCEVTLAHTLEQGMDALQEQLYQVVLLEYNLDQSQNGDDLISRLQYHAPHVPVIVLTDTENEAMAVEALKAGAQDYIIKGQFKVGSLMRSIRYARERQRLRRELEQSLQRRVDSAERQYRRLISDNVDGIVVVRQDGRISFANPKAEKYFRRSAMDLLGTPLGFPFDPEQALEISFPQEDRELYAELRAVQIEWENEPAYLLSFRDITDRKEQEYKLQNIAQSLSEQNVDLDRYARTVAHDLKAPLGVIVGYAETLLMTLELGLTEQEIQECMAQISRGGRKMQSIIEELLLLASVRQEKVELHPIEMESILSAVQDRLGHALEMSDAAVYIKNTSEPWPIVMGYRPWIEEVWVNYVSNAIKYGGTPPVIQLGYKPGTDGMIYFWVKDNGAGLSEAQKKELFKQYPDMKRMRADGHGLGLSIVRRIVTRLGGQVGVRSEPGGGSAFFFSLPAADLELIEQAVEVMSVES